MKKAARWKSFDFGPETKSPVKSPLQHTTLIQNEKSNKRTKSFHTKTKEFNFHKKLTPKTLSDLAVHPKKIQEVEGWLKLCLDCRQGEKKTSSFLLISGPTGSGKTTTVYTICKALNISISEWVNPMDHDFELFQGQSQVNRFLEFLTEAKWSSLFETANNMKITLVKDFPNAVIRQPEEFFNILEECHYKTKYPVIFICTDASNGSINLSRTLFPEDIMIKFNIAYISFNACAPGLMKNALKKAQSLVQENPDLFKKPSASTVEAILASAMGDIRNAMNQLYFACLLGSEDLPTVDNKFKKVGNKRKRNDKSSAVKSMSKDENLGLFHGLGRVLNPKRKETGNSWRIACDVGKLVDEFSTQPAMFTSFLFENYLKYFGDVGDASRAAEVLSLSVKFLDRWDDRYETLIFALWISVLGLMIFNEHKVFKWNQIRGPTKVNKSIYNHVEAANLNSTDYFYYNVIKKTDIFHRFNCDN